MKRPSLPSASSTLGGLLAAGLLFTSAAGAFEIDTLENIGAPGTAVGSRTIDGVTVTLSTGGGESMESRRYEQNRNGIFAFSGDTSNPATPYNTAFTPTNVSGDYFISNDSYFHGLGGLTLDFSENIKSFGLTTLDLMENYDSLGDNMELALRAYDATGNLVAEHARTGRQGPSGLDLDWVVSSLANDITRVTLTGTIGSGHGYGIDDLLVDAGSHSNAVPTPGSIVLLITGLVTIRRQSRRQ